MSLPPDPHHVMAIQSLLFLQEQDVPINCSVYSLTSGSIQFQDIRPPYSPVLGSPNSSGHLPAWKNWSSEFLPAYYITNCSIPDLIQLVIQSNITDTDDQQNKLINSPYNDRDNGDTFVALLFMVCGSCVSSWMLALLHYLSPKHKRKPLVVQLATIMYTVVMTISLSRLTDGSSSEYYNDTLDIVRLHELIYNNNTYRITVVISQILTQVAWFQIVLEITKTKWKWLTSCFGALIISAHTAVNIFCEVRCNNTDLIFDNTNMSYDRWALARVVIKLVLVVWFAGSLLYYTIMIKNPQKVCYSRRLLPLGIFNWFLFALHIVLSIFIISLFRDNWLVNIWLFLLPMLVEVIILTTVWEWVCNIRFLEKRFEMMGVLGRRISLEDMASLHSRSGKTRKVEVMSNFMSKFYNRNHVVAKDDTDNSMELKDFSVDSNVFTDATTKTNSDLSDTRSVMTRTHSENTSRFHNSQLENENNSNYNNHDSNDNDNDDNNDNVNNDNNNSVSNIVLNNHTLDFNKIIDSSHKSHDMNSCNTDTGGGDSTAHHRRAGSCDDEYVNNYEIWADDEDHENDASTQNVDYDYSQFVARSTEAPPPFQPHPGFSTGDYWQDRKENI